MKSVALYSRVSTNNGQQTCETQLFELRRYCEARGWRIYREYNDEGISGTVSSRPALDRMMADARRRKFDGVIVFKLDRIGRSLKDLVLLLEELNDLSLTFISLGESIDFTTSAGRLQLHILSALAQWERERIVERVKAGIARARSQGKRFGRPVKVIPEDVLAPVRGLPVRLAAKRLGVSAATVSRWLRKSVTQSGAGSG